MAASRSAENAAERLKKGLDEHAGIEDPGWRVTADRSRWWRAGQLLPFSLVTSLFFMWGVPNNLNDVLIRQFMKSFALSRVEAGLVQFAFYLDYFVLGGSGGADHEAQEGIRQGWLLACCCMRRAPRSFGPRPSPASTGSFSPRSLSSHRGSRFSRRRPTPSSPRWGLRHLRQARRLNFSQAFNTLGSIAGVLAGTVFIFSGVELECRQVEARKRPQALTPRICSTRRCGWWRRIWCWDASRLRWPLSSCARSFRRLSPRVARRQMVAA